MNIQLSLQKLDPSPILHPEHPDCVNTLFGFEGGTVHREGGFTYIFTTENYSEPKTCKVRLSSWKSSDGVNFRRCTTLREAEGIVGVRTSFNCGWAPNLVFSVEDNRWHCYYVYYTHKAEGADIYNMFGRIGILKSVCSGRQGIEGPYEKYGILNLCDDNQSWEGPCGQVSFFPYQVGEKWYGIYGSNSIGIDLDSHDKPQEGTPEYRFMAGIAESDSLNGPWYRRNSGNPLLFDPRFIENSIIKRIRDDLYFLLFDGGRKDEISYSCSSDGLNWYPAQRLSLPVDKPKELLETRTPLGLVENVDGSFDMYFTAYDGNNPDEILPLYYNGFGHVWKARVTVESI